METKVPFMNTDVQPNLSWIVFGWGDRLETPCAADKNQSRALLWELVSQVERQLLSQVSGKAGTVFQTRSSHKIVRFAF